MSDYIDADATGCLTMRDYGVLGLRTGDAAEDMGAPTLTIRVDGNADYDAMFIKLVSGNGVFAGGLASGTFDITGADAEFSGCGLCVRLLAQFGGQQPFVEKKTYVAETGRMTLTSTSPIAGSASALRFAEVDTLGNKVPGGCQTMIESLMFAPK